MDGRETARALAYALDGMRRCGSTTATAEAVKAIHPAPAYMLTYNKMEADRVVREYGIDERYVATTNYPDKLRERERGPVFIDPYAMTSLCRDYVRDMDKAEEKYNELRAELTRFMYRTQSLENSLRASVLEHNKTLKKLRAEVRRRRKAERALK